jgi:multiple sugar transport system substrate-binding protein
MRNVKAKGLIVSFLALSVVLAGCGSAAKTGTSTDSPATTPAGTTAATTTATPVPVPAAKVSIEYYTFPADQTENNKRLDATAASFMAKYPNVTMSNKNNWQYRNDEIAVKMAANSAPTEFTTWATEGKLLSDRKWIADLTDYLAAWPNTKDLNQTALKPFIIGGKTYAVPIDAYSMTITVNKKLFAAKGVALPPLDWTWDDFMAAAKAVNDPANNVAGFIPMGKGSEAGWNWTNFLYAAGGDVETVADGKVSAVFNSDAGVKAMTFYKNLNDAGVLPKNWALNYTDALNWFNQGRGAMVMCGSGNALNGAINQGGIKADDLAIYPIPSMTKGGKHTGVLGGNYKAINGLATKDQQQAAFNFVVDEYFSDAYIDGVSKQIDSQKADGNKTYVPQLINYWDDNSDYGKKVQAMFAKHDNVYKYAPELSALLDGKTEATYETQAYYSEVANVIQKVFTTKGVDVKKLLDDAAAKVQKDKFDKVKVN